MGIAYDADAWFICPQYPQLRVYLMEILRENDYTPKFITGPMGAIWDTYDPELTNYQTGVSFFEPEAKFDDTDNFGTLDEFATRYSKFGDPEKDLIDFIPYHAAIMCLVYSEAITDAVAVSGKLPDKVNEYSVYLI